MARRTSDRGGALLRPTRRVAAAARDGIEFAGNHPGMLLGRIARGQVPNRAGRETNYGAEPERNAPSKIQNDCCEQRRSESRPYPDAAENNAVRLATFYDRKPAFNKLVCCRIHDRLSGPKGNADQDQDQQGASHPGRNQSGQSRENAPPDHAERKQAPRAQTPRKNSAWDLKGGIADEKCAEDPTQSSIVDLEFSTDLDTGNRNIGAIQECYGAQNQEPQHEQVPYRRATPLLSDRIPDHLFNSLEESSDQAQ